MISGHYCISACSETKVFQKVTEIQTQDVRKVGELSPFDCVSAWWILRKSVSDAGNILEWGGDMKYSLPAPKCFTDSSTRRNDVPRTCIQTELEIADTLLRC